MNTEPVAQPEIVIGLTSAIGSDLTGVGVALRSALMSVGYSTSELRVSSEIALQVDQMGIITERGQSPDETAMNKGDALRTSVAHGGAAALITVAAIQRDRASAIGNSESVERNAHVTIVRQLKHPAEVEVLRDIYGSRFILIGCSMSIQDRLDAMKRRLQDQVPNKTESWYVGYARELVDRDEKDGQTKYGQRVRDTFQLADAYLTLQGGVLCEPDVRRLIRAFFGDPFSTPSMDEQAMFHAYGARLRSSAGGRQVGAVVVDESGEVLVTGTNEVPRPGGGQNWDGDHLDYRDFVAGFDFNDREKTLVVSDLMQRLLSHEGWLAPEIRGLDAAALAAKALSEGGPVAESRVADLLEFGRIMHAEMALICTAARRGTSVGGCTMYTTTYPCHECARLIIGAGISRVVYVDPYPKSMVSSMYADQTTDDANDRTRVRFEAFAGVAPRVFDGVFAMRGRGRDQVSGKYDPWQQTLATPKLMDETDFDPLFLDREDALVVGLTWLVDPRGEGAQVVDGNS